MGAGPVSPFAAPMATWHQCLTASTPIARVAQSRELLGPAGWQSWAGLTGFPCPIMVLPLQRTIAQATSRVCGKMRLLSGPCKKIMRPHFRRISSDIMAGKTPCEICVDIKLCKSQAGECRGDHRDSFLEDPRQPPQACVTWFKNKNMSVIENFISNSYVSLQASWL